MRNDAKPNLYDAMVALAEVANVEKMTPEQMADFHKAAAALGLGRGARVANTSNTSNTFFNAQHPAGPQSTGDHTL